MKDKLESDVLTPHLIHQFDSERELLNIISKLSHAFNQRTDSVNDYSHDPALVSAYAMFYLPTNMPKLEFILEKLPVEVYNSILESEFIDFGSGPGTFSLAFKNLVGTSQKSVISLIDKSESMLLQARKIINSIYPRGEYPQGEYPQGELPEGNFKYYNSYKQIRESKNSTLCLGHVFNEMEKRDLIKVIEHFDPQNIIFIGPGTKEVFHKLSEFRKSFLSDHYDVAFPCPSKSFDCPMEGDEKNWCHQILHTTHSQGTERLSQLVKLDRRKMPMTAQMFTKTNFEPEETSRIVRKKAVTKFSFDFEICRMCDGVPLLQDLEVPKRGMGKLDQKAYQKIDSGNGGELTVLKVLSDSKLRGNFNNLR
ncbi:MAG: hypothetical protein HOE90_14675 [Bacteriovoracaceae bacterium]|nr:hypothetical protein [Bacteriovoracaceae bacterium]